MGVQNVFELAEVRPLNPGEVALTVIGDPVAHSLSPSMHNAALAALADEDSTFANWRYRAVRVPPEHLEDAVVRLWNAGFRGINLTLPHKVNVVPLLKMIDPEARQMGAVNTLHWQEDGYHGYNTDGYGIIKAVEEQFGIGVEDRVVWIFGAGGAARAIAVACMNRGCGALRVVNRSRERLDALLAGLENGLGADSRVQGYLSHELTDAPTAGALVINATSLGLKAADPSPVPETWLIPELYLYDTTYGCRNALAQICAKAGIAYSDGLSMLVWQGVRSLEIWSGRTVPSEEMARVARESLATRTQSC